MSLEDRVHSFKSVITNFKKSLLPFALSASFFVDPTSSQTYHPPIIEWEKTFNFTGQSLALPVRVSQLNDSDYLLFGLTRELNDENCLPLFTSLFSKDNITTPLSEKFGVCINSHGKFFRLDPSSHLLSTSEYIHTETDLIIDYKINKIDNSAKIVKSVLVPDGIFEDDPNFFEINNQLYALGNSPDKNGLSIISLDDNLQIKPNSLVKISTNSNLLPISIKTNDNDIFISARRYVNYSIYPTFIRLDSNFNIISNIDYPQIGTTKGNLELIGDNLYFSTDLQYPSNFYQGIAFYKTDLNGNPLPSFPRKIPISFKYQNSFMKNNDDNFIVFSSIERFNSPLNSYKLTSLDSSSNPLWSKEYADSSPRILHGINLTSDGGYILCGKEKSADAFVLKLSPEIYVPEIFSPIGVHGYRFDVNIDGYNFESWTPSQEESQNQFIEFIKNVLDSSLPEKNSSPQNISEYYPLIVPYLQNNPDKNDFGLSLSSAYYFTDPLYFLENGSGIQMPTFQRDINEESTLAKIKREQQKFPLLVMARNSGIISSENSKETLSQILSNENEPALIHFTSSQGKTKSVLAYKLENNKKESLVYFYDPSLPSQEKTSLIDSNGLMSYEDSSTSFVSDISWLSAGGVLQETLNLVKDKYLDDLIRSGVDIVTIFPQTFSKTSQENFLFVDSSGNKYGYENSIFHNELPIIQSTLHGLTYFSIPSDLEYQLFLSNSSNQNISVVNSTPYSQIILSYENISSPSLKFDSASNILYQGINPQAPSSIQENVSIYDLNSDRRLDSTDLFLLSNFWRTSQDKLNYDQRYLLNLFKNLK